MTVEFALFLSPEGIALAHRQPEGHWALIGETSLDVPDLGRRLTWLRELGEARAGADFPALLILPDDQILYTDLSIPEGRDLNLRAAVEGALDGRTPYALGELAYDFRPVGPGRVQIAAVAQETLTEALDFARAAGINGVGFAATPPASKFEGVPIFEIADGIGGLDLQGDGLAMGEDGWGGDAPGDPPEDPPQTFVTEAPAPAAPPPHSPPRPALAPGLEAADSAAPAFAVGGPQPAAGAFVTARRKGDPGHAVGRVVKNRRSRLELLASAEAERPAAHDPTILADEEAAFDFGHDRPAPEPAAFAGVETDEISTDPVEEEETATAAPDAEAAVESSSVSDAEDPPSSDAEADPDTGSELAVSSDAAPATDDDAAIADDIEAEAATDVPDATATDAAGAAPEVELEAPDPDGGSPELPAGPDAEPDHDASPDPERETDSDRDASHEAESQPEPEPAPEPQPEPEPTPEPAADAEDGSEPRPWHRPVADPGAADPPKPPKKKRVAKTPALFAGVSRPGPMRADDGTLAAFDGAPDDGVSVLGRDDVPAGLPPGLAARLRLRRSADVSTGVAEIEAPPPSTLRDAPPAAGVAFGTAAPTLDRTSRPAEAALAAGPADDTLITGGLLGRRTDASARPSLRTALVLTMVFILLLALVAVWSALFLPDSRVAQLLGRVAPEIDTPVASASDTAEAAGVVDDLAIAPVEDPASAAVTAPSAEADPPSDLPIDLSTDSVAQTPGSASEEAVPQPDAPPAPTLAWRPPPTPEEAAADYAETGIWQLAPDAPAAPGRDFVIPEPDPDIALAPLGPAEIARAAASTRAPDISAVPRGAPPPPPPTALAPLSAATLTAATADGVLTPQGAFVILGAPAVPATPRPAAIAGAPGPEAAPEPETATDDTIDVAAVTTDPAAPPLGVSPLPRPGDVPGAEAPEPQNGTIADIATAPATRPLPRPGAAPDLGSAVEEALADALDDDTAAAVTVSPLPTQRPAGLAAAAAAATSASDAERLATPAPLPAPSVEPDIPSSASVSRTATVEDALDLREVNLIGVRGTPDDRTALVRLPSGRFVSVQVGDRLDGGRVAAIGPDSLQYIRNGRNITLRAPSG